MSSHAAAAARFSNLAAFQRVPEAENEDEDGEDPDEVAYRERLRKLAEDDTESVHSDPFGLNMGSRQTAASTYADDKLTADAQRALDAIRRTSMAVPDDDINARLSVWTENPDDEGDESVFKAQQARLKALAAAAQPASHVRTQLTKATMPKPPGLADAEKIKQMRERQQRLSLAETAAMVAATGVDAELVKPHIEQVVHAKVAAVSAQTADHRPAPPIKPVIAPPPGLNFAPKTPPAPPAPPVPPSEVSNGPAKPAPPSPPAFMAPKRASMVDKSSESRKSVSIPDDQSKALETKKSTSSVLQGVPRTSSIDGVLPNGPQRSKSARFDKGSSSAGSKTAKGDTVDLFGRIIATRAMLDVLTWRAPVLAVTWMLFGICLVLALLSRNWSSLTVWALFALMRILFLRSLSFIERVAPVSLKKILVVQHTNHLPGSFQFLRDLLVMLAGSLRELESVALKKPRIALTILAISTTVGSLLNIGVTIVTLLFVLSIFAATYVALPRMFEPIFQHLPQFKTILQKL